MITNKLAMKFVFFFWLDQRYLIIRLKSSLIIYTRGVDTVIRDLCSAIMKN